MQFVRLVLLAAAAGLLSPSALGFQESSVGGSSEQQAPAQTLETPKSPAEQGKGLNLTLPDLGGAKSGGTEVRIPGIGTVGVLPKLDFGLELLYGANDKPKGVPEDRLDNDTNDVQIRGTIKHRF
jgi:hypothetical protein